MPKCPKCEKEIDRLKNLYPVWQELEFKIDESGNPHYHLVDNAIPMGKDEKYICPECFETLFTTEEEAVKFLKGETSQKGE